MSWITENKGQKPWPNIIIPNKMGYSDSTEWGDKDRAIGTSHPPCGHWHKGPAIAPGSVSYMVAAEADNGYEAFGFQDLRADNGYLVMGPWVMIGNQALWAIYARFLNVQIPKGATITSAVLRLYHSSTVLANGSFLCNAHFVLSGNASVPLNGTLFEALSLTAGVAWTFAAYSSPYSNDPQNSPNLKDILQNVIDLPAYSAGSAIMCVVKTDITETGSSYTQLESYKTYIEGESPHPAPQLLVSYT